MSRNLTLVFLAFVGCNQEPVVVPEVEVEAPAALTTRGIINVFASKMVRNGALTSETRIVADFTRFTDGLGVDVNDDWGDSWGCRTVSTDPVRTGRVGVNVSAGDLTLTLADEPLANLSPRSDRTYASQTVDQVWNQSGQRLTVRATGASVEPFSASLTVPTRVTILSAPSEVTRTSDVTLKWQGGSTGVLYLDLGSTRSVVRCRFNASDGAATIPSSTLAVLEAGTGWIAAELNASQTVETGDALVSVMASYRVITADGAWFSKPIQIQ